MSRKPTAALVLSALLWSSLASAQPSSEAAERFQRAVELADEGAYAEALVEFQRAYELRPHPSVLYNIAQTHVALGQPVEAVVAFEKYLQAGGATLSKARRAEVERELLRQLGRIARLRIGVRPAGAAVRIDGRDVGVAPLSDVIRVRLGTHQLEISHSGYKTEHREIRVAGGEEKTIEIDLVPLGTGKAKLQIDCALPDVRVEVDDKLMATTPLKRPLSLEAGSRRIALRRDGYSDDVQRLSLAGGAAARIGCRLVPRVPLPPELRATLSLRIDQPGATVRVDGRTFSQTGHLPAGRHVIEVTRAGFEPWSRELSLQAGEQQLIEVELRPNADVRTEQRARASTQRFWAYTLGGAGAALGLTALGLYLWNDGRHDEWSDEQDVLDAEAAQGPPFPQDYAARQRDNDDLLESVQRWDGITVGVGIAGGALLTTGVVLFVTGDDPGKYARAPAIVPAPGGGMLSWTSSW